MKEFKTKFKSNIERCPSSRWEMRLRGQAGQMVKQGFWWTLPLRLLILSKVLGIFLLPPLRAHVSGFGSASVKDTEDTYQSPHQPMHGQEVFYPRVHHH